MKNKFNLHAMSTAVKFGCNPARVGDSSLSYLAFVFLLTSLIFFSRISQDPVFRPKQHVQNARHRYQNSTHFGSKQMRHGFKMGEKMD